MNSPNLRVRRGTLEDLPVLKSLWESMRFPGAELERQLTDFQVLVDAQEQVCGAMAFRMSGRHAYIHSEGYTDFGLAEQARALFWTRFQSLATNHGLVALWTREQSPFWSHYGFNPADARTLEKLPDAWDRNQPGWLVLKLKDEEAIAQLEKEFALFVQSEKARSEQAIGQMKTLKTIATVIVLLACAALLAWGIYLFVNRSSLPQLGP